MVIYRYRDWMKGSPDLNTSAGMPSGPGAYSVDICLISLATSSSEGIMSRFGLTATWGKQWITSSFVNDGRFNMLWKSVELITQGFYVCQWWVLNHLHWARWAACCWWSIRTFKESCKVLYIISVSIAMNLLSIIAEAGVLHGAKLFLDFISLTEIGNRLVSSTKWCLKVVTSSSLTPGSFS